MAINSNISKPGTESGRSSPQMKQYVVSNQENFDEAPIPGIPLRNSQVQSQGNAQENVINSRNKKYIPDGATVLDHKEVKRVRESLMQEQQAREAESVNILFDRIKYLTNIGRKTLDVPITSDNANVLYSLQTLKGTEKFAVSEVVEKSTATTIQVRNEKGELEHLRVPTSTSLYNIKIATLGHALYAIDNIDINQLLGLSNYEEDIQYAQRKIFVQDMDDSLSDYLFTQYNVLFKEVQDGYSRLGKPEVIAEAISKSSQDA
jgi:hypothetical protein